MNYSDKFNEYRTAVEEKLIEVMGVQPHRECDTAKASEYSLFSGGKRIRGVLTLAVCDMLCGSYDKALDFAAAMEMVHCYSLIHDDLPCMDDDDMRRGMPSCHKKYGEATALLAGDNLLTSAFAVVATAELSAQTLLTAVQLLSYSAGTGGMIYGQELDLLYEGKQVTESQLLEVHRNKTGALISVAAQLGALAGDADGEQFLTLRDFAYTLGLAFQVVDDILDGSSSVDLLGKPIGSDEQQGKTTFLTLYGEEKAQRYAKDLCDNNVRSLTDVFGDKAEFLLLLQQELLHRKY